VQGELAKVEASADEDVRTGLDALIKKENWLAAELELYGDPPPATMRPFEVYGPTPPPVESEVPLDEDGKPASSEDGQAS